MKVTRMKANKKNVFDAKENLNLLELSTKTNSRKPFKQIKENLVRFHKRGLITENQLFKILDMLKLDIENPRFSFKFLKSNLETIKNGIQRDYDFWN